MTDITQSEIFKIATPVQSSATNPLPIAKPGAASTMNALQQHYTYEGCSEFFSLGKLYGKSGNVAALINAIFEAIKSKETDPMAKEKISHMHKCIEQLWNFFASNSGKQLMENEFAAILAGYITSCYEKQNIQN